MTVMTEKALRLMREAHQKQTRWGGEPYSEHPEKVVKIIQHVFNIDPCEHQEIIAAAYLHDVLEDTTVTYDKLVEEFGDDVAKIVKSLTFPNKVSESQYLTLVNQLPWPANIIKMADIIANLTDGTESQSHNFMKKRLTAFKIILERMNIH